MDGHGDCYMRWCILRFTAAACLPSQIRVKLAQLAAAKY